MPDPVASHTAAEHRRAVRSFKSQPEEQAAGRSLDHPPAPQTRPAQPIPLATPAAFRAICARVTGSIESLPLPSHPALTAWASVMNGAGHWATFYDAKWRYAFETDELLSTFADMAWVPVPQGTHFFSAILRQQLADP